MKRPSEAAMRAAKLCGQRLLHDGITPDEQVSLAAIVDAETHHAVLLAALADCVELLERNLLDGQPCPTLDRARAALAKAGSVLI